VVEARKYLTAYGDGSGIGSRFVNSFVGVPRSVSYCSREFVRHVTDELGVALNDAAHDGDDTTFWQWQYGITRELWGRDVGNENGSSGMHVAGKFLLPCAACGNDLGIACQKGFSSVYECTLRGRRSWNC